MLGRSAMVEPAGPDTQEVPTHRSKGMYFGWWIVVISSIFHGLAGGLYHTGLSVYFLQLTRDFGISHTKLSVVFALRTLEGGVEGPVIGYLTDRLGPRVMTVAGVLLAGSGFSLLATTHSFAMFMLVFLALVTVGFSMQSAAFIVAVVHWFRRRLGWALSLSSSGSAIGGFLLTPAMAWVVIVHGWRWAASVSGILLLVLGLPLALAVREPFKGETARDEGPSSTPAELPTDALSGTSAKGVNTDNAAGFQADFKVSDALHTSTYWLVAVAIGLRLTAKSALTVHMVPILVSGGVSEGTAAILVAIMALIRLPSMLGAGLIGDRWSRSKMAALSMLVGTITAAAMVWGPGGLASGIMFAILFAGAQSSDSITWALIGQYFGRKNFGTLRGGVTLIQSLMSTAGPIVAGWTFDRTGSYEKALLGIGIIYAMAAFVFWILRTPARPVSKESAKSRAYRPG